MPSFVCLNRLGSALGRNVIEHLVTVWFKKWAVRCLFENGEGDGKASIG